MKNLPIIQNKIHEIRGLKVMLDFDLADLYEVETKALNQAVKRNSDRFPEDFMFKLTAKEWEAMQSQIVTASGNSQDMNWSQFVTSSKKHRGKTYLPYAFTEHGVTMPAYRRQAGQCIAQRTGSKNEYRYSSCLYCAEANIPL